MSKKNGHKPKIILFDLETMPDMDLAFDRWTGLSKWYGTTFSADLQSIICFGYKELGSTIKIKNAWDFEGFKTNVNDDKELCKFIFDILSTADVIVTQNGKAFDLPFLQTRLLKNKLPLLPKIVHIDTKIIAKRNLKMSSNSLNNLSKFFKDNQKLENGGWDLWTKVRKRDEKAMKLMSSYCKKDVVLLEELYNILLPFISIIPNYNNFSLEGDACPSCGKQTLTKSGTRITKTNIFTRFLCKNCGSWCQKKKEDSIFEAI